MNLLKRATEPRATSQKPKIDSAQKRTLAEIFGAKWILTAQCSTVNTKIIHTKDPGVQKF